MRIKLTLLTVAACCAALLAYFLVGDAPAPDEAEAGSMLSEFSASRSMDPPVDASNDFKISGFNGSLYVEILEFFYDPGPVPIPTLTVGPEGAARVHLWVSHPRVRLFGTKCEFVRRVRFAIPKASLAGATSLSIVNHDTQSRQLLAESAELDRLLRAPEVLRPNLTASNADSITGGGCGA